jgi:hypothetical protein
VANPTWEAGPQFTAVTGSTATGTIVVPSGWVAGDLAYLAVMQSGGQTITISSTNPSATWATSSALQAWNGTTDRLTIYENVLTAADLGSTVTVTFGAAQLHVEALVALGNHNGRNAASAALIDTVADTSGTFNSVTPSVADCAVVYFAGSAMTASLATGPTASTPTNYTEALDTTNLGTNLHAQLSVGYRMLTGGSGAAETPSTITLTQTARSANLVLAVAPKLGTTVSPTGIATGQAFGVPTVTLSVQPTGITSAEAVGAPTVTLSVLPTGITSGQALGVPTVTLTALPAGIVSAEAFGTPTVTLAAGATTVSPTGVVTGEAFGTPTVTLVLSPAGIVTAEAFGVPAVGRQVAATGISTGEAFGVPAVSMAGPSTVSPTGIGSAQALGVPTVSMAGPSTLTLVGISSAEAFGAPTVSVPTPSTLSPAGIATAEAFGAPTATLVLAVLVLSPDPILTAEAFGLPVCVLRSYVFTGPTSTDLHRFRPHPELEHPDLGNELLIHQPALMVDHVVGLTVYRDPAGVWHATAYASWAQQQSADRFYAGGRLHPVDQAQAAELIAAGYGDYLTPT